MKSILETEKGVCYLCGARTQTEEHHIFGGNPRRKYSEKYGLKVYLCHHCHRDNKSGVHGNREKMRLLHQEGQKAFERNHTREEFVRLFSRNYLDEEEQAHEKEDSVQPVPDTREKPVPDGFYFIL